MAFSDEGCLRNIPSGVVDQGPARSCNIMIPPLATVFASKGEAPDSDLEATKTEPVASTLSATNDGQVQTTNRGGLITYTRSLFPFLSWIGHYNSTWLASDFVAGITVGAIVVPQGMAYATLAKLEPQYGLYSSFIGVMIYWLFGTSKDISIGPVAVLSNVVGNVVNDVNRSRGQQVDPIIIASTLSIVTGCVVLAIGLLRAGRIVDLISPTALAAFMTGSAITITASQLPSLLGLSGFSNRESPYAVTTNTFRNLGGVGIDAALGLSALLLLYLIRFILTTAAERAPKHKKAIFFVNTLRTVLIIALFTVLSLAVNRDRPNNPAFDIIGTVPRGS